jgi:hypothetical protein
MQQMLQQLLANWAEMKADRKAHQARMDAWGKEMNATQGNEGRDRCRNGSHLRRNESHPSKNESHARQEDGSQQGKRPRGPKGMMAEINAKMDTNQAELRTGGARRQTAAMSEK